MAHSKEKCEPTETIPVKDYMQNLLDKDYKTSILNIIKELKEDRESQENVGLAKCKYQEKEKKTSKETRKKKKKEINIYLLRQISSN